MGQLFYANTDTAVEIDDTLLAHLQVVASTKLRRSESFTLTLRRTVGGKAGRETLWLQPSIPLRFQFESAEPVRLDPAVLRGLAEQANSTAGLTVDLDAAGELPAQMSTRSRRPQPALSRVA
ncbi:hypothetical protein LQ938_02640 [Microbacterium sp. cx-55]|uniref:DUF7882 family protein n=1 Tax=unclassified Microbacterium TaxID=2609290 RepID=UPI001CBD6F11|nr:MULTISPECIES: hypothetical protein [unclassified Microbacterium]MBZ4487705.1 hypothetical protein [Microbacterium sp. cx-55]MCC4908144.1 hypothetical protein [Microbacterium sp. cx-59]UGB35716.1 hypothetical protein LQ938_02640 [Microbacterium sp. cx-55]